MLFRRWIILWAVCALALAPSLTLAAGGSRVIMWFADGDNDPLVAEFDTQGGYRIDSSIEYHASNPSLYYPCMDEHRHFIVPWW